MTLDLKEMLKFVDTIEISLSAIQNISLTTAQVARRAKTCKRTVRRWCESGKIVAYQDSDNGDWYISRADWELKKARLTCKRPHPPRG